MATCDCNHCVGVRAQLARRLRWYQTALRRIELSARDDLESLGLLVARMAEVEEQLSFAIEQFREEVVARKAGTTDE